MTATRLFLAIAIASALGCGADSDVESKLQAATSSLRRGIWVYRNAGLETNAGREALKQLIRDHGINNVYLSGDAALLARPEFASLLAWMAGNNVRAEALFDSNNPNVDAGCDAVASRLGSAVSYNQAHPDATFKGVHVDIEPWIGTGDSLAWVAPLTRCYERLQQQARLAGMPLVADIAGAKLKNAQIGERQAVLNAVTRLVLMQYEIDTGSKAVARTAEFLAGLQPPPNPDGTQRGVIVALRSKDFADAFGEAARVESALQDAGLYAGWAVYADDILHPDAGLH